MPLTSSLAPFMKDGKERESLTSATSASLWLDLRKRSLYKAPEPCQSNPDSKCELYTSFVIMLVGAVAAVHGDEDTYAVVRSCKGSVIVRPQTDKFSDFNSRFEFSHRVALISDEIYEVYNDPSNTLCANALQRVDECTSGINMANILDPLCDAVNLDPTCGEATENYLKYWANDKEVQKALYVREKRTSLTRFCSQSTCTFIAAARYGSATCAPSFVLSRDASWMRIQDEATSVKIRERECNDQVPSDMKNSFSIDRRAVRTHMHDYIVIDSPRAVAFRDSYGVQMIMRFNEIHKFNDGTLQQIDEALDYRVKEFRVNKTNPEMNTRFWTKKDVVRSKEFMFSIQKRLKTRCIFRNLESFVGGTDSRRRLPLLKRTE
ncbi:peptidase S10, serine carboxypeptidase, alpha/beta hydrolase fold protein [Tanacetum coccineum]